MITEKILNNHKFLLLIGVCMFFSSCYEEKVGCLNIESSNYDLTADVACEDCCTYPSLTLWIGHKALDESLSFDSIYLNEKGQEYSIVDYSILLSAFSFEDDQNEIFQALDSVSASFQGVDGYLRNDIAKVERQNIQYDLGSFKTKGNLESFSFKTGISEFYRTADLSSLASSNPLSDSLLLADDGLINNAYFDIHRIATDDTLRVVWEKNASHEDVYFDIQAEVNPGFNIEINLDIDFVTWLYTIDIESDDNATICEKMVLNVPSSFKLL